MSALTKELSENSPVALSPKTAIQENTTSTKYSREKLSNLFLELDFFPL
jgi:hypothetical protein